MKSSYQEMTSRGSYNEATRKRTNAEIQSHERFAQAREWCKRHLPDEHPDLAASSTLTLRLHGRWPTPKQVLDRLRAQGRDAKSREETT